MCFSKKKISPSGIVHEPNTSRYKVGSIAYEGRYLRLVLSLIEVTNITVA